MINVGVVILNYLAYKTTIETLESFLKQDTDGFHVEYVVVDNCSPNESYEELLRYAEQHPSVSVYKTEKNLGFANGNNFGYQQLIQKMTPEFVVISNDDILLNMPGLFQWINTAYQKYGFSVLGPDVYSVRGKFHQSPSQNRSRDLRELKTVRDNCRKAILILRLKKLLGRPMQNSVPAWSNDLYQQFSEELTLHGSFQIFSKTYFEQYDTPYDPSTFLYLEEDILKLRCDQKNLKMIYDPSYKIEHLQAVSTGMVCTDAYNKAIIRNQHLVRSLNIFMDLLKKG